MSKTDITDLSEAPEVALVEKASVRKTVAKEVKGANSDGELSGKRVTLTIHATAEEAGDEDVFVGLNGYGYTIKRGEPCNVPEEVAAIIGGAKYSVMRPAKDGGGLVESETPRFAYSITA